MGPEKRVRLSAAQLAKAPTEILAVVARPKKNLSPLENFRLLDRQVVKTPLTISYSVLAGVDTQSLPKHLRLLVS